LIDLAVASAKTAGHPAGARRLGGFGNGRSDRTGTCRYLPAAKIHAVDCSQAASAIARMNANSWDLQTGFTFIRVLGGASITQRPSEWHGGKSALYSQYSGAAATTRSAHHEPQMALDGGADGLNVSDIW